MYVPTHFDELRLEVLHDLVRSHPLATFITQVDNEIVVNHIPFFLKTSGDDTGVLHAHIPRANFIWEQFGGQEAVSVFQGPESYVSPSWYPSKHEHGKVVPTWNYVVVHAHGRPTAIHDPEWLMAHLQDLTNQHEGGQTLPWKVSDAPENFTEKLVGMLVGIEIPISSLIGKWKVSQNRPVGDQLGVAAGLRSRGDENSLAMEKLVLQYTDE